MNHWRREGDLRIAYDHPMAPDLIGNHLRHLLEDSWMNGEGTLVCLCIGTDRSTGDALGPLVGQRITAMGLRQVVVLGTLDHPVHASNLAETLAQIEQAYPSQTILAIDACLGQTETIGTVTVGTGALRPGAGVNKHLPPAGHLFITGTVNVGGIMEYLVLQNTRLSLVMRMAETIAVGIKAGLQSQKSTDPLEAGQSA